jgi:hypothetical protein
VEASVSIYKHAKDTKQNMFENIFINKERLN